MIEPPIQPMLAAAADTIPAGMLYEPKWDGWRCVCFVRDGQVRLYSRRGTELTADFPELVVACSDQLPSSCVLDGEIVILSGDRLEYSHLARRHAAGGRAATLAVEMPASFVIFDVLEVAGEDVRAAPQLERRRRLEDVLSSAVPPLVLTPATTDLATAQDWFDQFEHFGLDGVVAKPLRQPYRAGTRSLVKVKHRRTADVVAGGFRWDRNASAEHPSLGSLLLGAFTDGQLHFLGVTAAFPQHQRRELAELLGGLQIERGQDHPWSANRPVGARGPDAPTRRGHEQLRLIDPLLVCEVAFDALHPDPSGIRFRSNATFVRWRVDKAPEDCLLADLGADLSGAPPDLQQWWQTAIGTAERDHEADEDDEGTTG